jgi:chromate reductase, NAD(P)H dehydrogenase (quinone)
VTLDSVAAVVLLLLCGSLQARSANAAVLDVVRERAVAAGNTVVDFAALREVPPFDPDLGEDPGDAVVALRAAIGAADAVVIAGPEYAGSLAGTLKNALDWIVGSGELYDRIVGVASAGTTGGGYAREVLVRTLVWQGAQVVASLGLDAPRTRSDAEGRITDADTVGAVDAFTDVVVGAGRLDPADRLALRRAVAEDAGVDPARIVVGS